MTTVTKPQHMHHPDPTNPRHSFFVCRSGPHDLWYSPRTGRAEFVWKDEKGEWRMSNHDARWLISYRQHNYLTEQARDVLRAAIAFMGDESDQGQG